MPQNTVSWPQVYKTWNRMWPKPNVDLRFVFPEGTTHEQALEFMNKMDEMIQVAREELGWSA